MKKHIILAMFLVLNSLFCFAQSTEEQSKNSALSASIDLASFNMSYTAPLGKKLYLGLGLGGGLSFVYGSFNAPFKKDWTKEAYHYKIFIGNAPTRPFHFRIGVLFSNFFYDDSTNNFEGEKFSGVYTQLFYGKKKIKVGTKVAFGTIGEQDKNLFLWTPIILQYNIFFAEK